MTVRSRLRLGPMLRHVSETSATIWVETEAPGSVTVVAGEQTAHADTFTVHGHHYALCDVEGLPPASGVAYRVLVDGTQVWPEPDSPHPPSLIHTIDSAAPTRLVFGSCHTPTDHSTKAILRYGVDMVRAYALRLAQQRQAQGAAAAGDQEPTVLLLIGDQVYADELQPQMVNYLAERRAGRRREHATAQAGSAGEATAPAASQAGDPLADAPEDEVVFFEEYAELYRQAWADPDIRWLLSTVPTLMLFDDHDIRDDWNTSGAWRRAMERSPWWRQRITSGLSAYWVYQHAGNLSPAERAVDPVFAEVSTTAGDAGEQLDAFAWRANEDPTSYRWSHSHDIAGSRIVMVDNRCARVVDDDRQRTMLDADEAAWLDERLTGDVDHLVFASTLPFLMPAGVHYLEAWNEAVCAGAWGQALRGPGEKMRQEVDLEHWAAFQHSFRAVSDAVLRVAAGERGAAPASVLFLGGDVHFSYLARAQARDSDHPARASRTQIAQLVCSPVCNWMPPMLRRMVWMLVRGITAVVCRTLARMAGVSAPALAWRLAGGPWYDNTLATLVLDGRTAEVKWEHSPVRVSVLRRLGSDEPEQPQIREAVRYPLA
ncbi:alkaline phosphatase D family protein [Salinactinospora qingdaonensis]|uniref:Alkaline phosphatase D family protein n=1 Tax=Salinactinospora qingdaonensis TaxID=702744 RepID=A0ABP7F3K5_9ACTN